MIPTPASKMNARAVQRNVFERHLERDHSDHAAEARAERGRGRAASASRRSSSGIVRCAHGTASWSRGSGSCRSAPSTEPRPCCPPRSVMILAERRVSAGSPASRRRGQVERRDVSLEPNRRQAIDGCVLVVGRSTRTDREASAAHWASSTWVDSGIRTMATGMLGRSARHPRSAGARRTWPTTPDRACRRRGRRRTSLPPPIGLAHALRRAGGARGAMRGGRAASAPRGADRPTVGSPARVRARRDGRPRRSGCPPFSADVITDEEPGTTASGLEGESVRLEESSCLRRRVARDAGIEDLDASALFRVQGASELLDERFDCEIDSHAHCEGIADREVRVTPASLGP